MFDNEVGGRGFIPAMKRRREAHTFALRHPQHVVAVLVSSRTNSWHLP